MKKSAGPKIKQKRNMEYAEPFPQKSIEYREECQILMVFEMTEKKMSSWSLCMIVKNEEDVLERCLNSVRELVDEIIIVDTGSEDGTKQTAERFTDQIYDFQWGDDFAAARNFSFARASGDYLMWMDADEDVYKRQPLWIIMM